MRDYHYRVIMNGELVAERMELNYALVLLEALMREYYAEPGIFITISREKESEEGETE